ncbi:hypothetical protein CVT24_000728 [Panaeolus cyanescens]|uniref:Cyanovirin-N domain-containing protein n=1 Tax=Panaeolus cyanescens TaxID=181874 RepID=A0A409YT34_9AGAR|nr:hypothetical protein CVT24_000728 [Panaeolus cyanescens]
MQFNRLTLLIAAAALTGLSQAYVVQLYTGTECTGDSWERNVWDNTCAHEKGFQSFRMTTNGGSLQLMTIYSPQACAGVSTFQGCVTGVNSITLGQCFNAVNGAGGSNALSSYSSAAHCPN